MPRASGIRFVADGRLRWGAAGASGAGAGGLGAQLAELAGAQVAHDEPALGFGVGQEMHVYLVGAELSGDRCCGVVADMALATDG